MSLVVASGLHGLGPGIVVGAEIDLALEIVEWSGHIRLMGHPQRDYHYRLRKYARRRGVIWRWFIFDSNGDPIETGVVLEPDRDKAEAAGKEALERLKRMPPSAHSLGMVPGAVGHNDPGDHAAS